MKQDYEMSDIETKRQGSSASSLFTGFLIGGLAGVIAAFLMAPQSGEETRSQLREKGMELKDRAMTTMDETRSRAEQALVDTKDRAKSTMEETRTRAEQVLADTKVRAGEKLQDISSKAEEVARNTRQQAEDMTQQAKAERSDSQSSM